MNANADKIIESPPKHWDSFKNNNGSSTTFRTKKRSTSLTPVIFLSTKIIITQHICWKKYYYNYNYKSPTSTSRDANWGHDFAKTNTRQNKKTKQKSIRVQFISTRTKKSVTADSPFDRVTRVDSTLYRRTMKQHYKKKYFKKKIFTHWNGLSQYWEKRHEMTFKTTAAFVASVAVTCLNSCAREWINDWINITNNCHIDIRWSCILRSERCECWAKFSNVQN